VKRITKFYKILQKSQFICPLLIGVAAGVEHVQILQNLVCEIIVDIGANRGQFALVARECFPSAKIISFEPLKEPATVFRRVFSNDPRVVLNEVAIGSDDREMVIHVSRADDSSSLLPISSQQSKLFPGTEEKEERKVKVKRLDAVLRREDIEQPALLKIDVQGFERDVLEGCKSLLACFSYVYVECSFVELYSGQALAHEIIKFLEGFNFVLSGIYNLYYDKKGVAIQGDFLFERK
jgi:FkbM family methyltransferase